MTDKARGVFNDSRQRLGRFFNRFRQPDAEEKDMPPTLPEIIDEPSLKSLERDLQQDTKPEFDAIPDEFKPEQPFSQPAPVSPDDVMPSE